MRVFVTGGTGFIGSRVVERLRARGDDVVALVRSPEKATRLRELGCELVEGDLGAADAIRSGAQGADAVVHIAADYRVGIPKRERPELHKANVEGTELVLDAAQQGGAGKVVYVSTGNVFGNTGETVADESYERDVDEGFLSYYDETKYRSHQIAKERIAQGAPIVIVQPGGVYGPGDHSQLGNFIDQTREGKLHMYMFPEFELSLVHVDDIADGIVLALDKGQPGESYILGGEMGTLRDLIDTVARLSGRKPPRVTMPAIAMKASIPIGPIVGKVMGFPPNLAELIKTSDGVKIRMTDAKARRELGYSPRGLEQGLRETLAGADGQAAADAAPKSSAQ